MMTPGQSARRRMFLMWNPLIGWDLLVSAVVSFLLMVSSVSTATTSSTLIMVDQSSSPPLMLTPATYLAYSVLSDAKVVSFGKAGYGARTPAADIAFRLVMADPAADRIFRKLLASRSPESEIYALCGLWHTDRAQCREAAQAFYSKDQRTVTLMQGCVGHETKVCDIVSSHVLTGDLPRTLMDIE